MKPRALGVYIFAGGFTQGMKKHCEVLAHLEDAPYLGTETSQLNHPKVPIYFRHGKSTWDEADQFHNKVDVVYANPPCAIVSPIGKSMHNGADNWRTDPRLSCWQRSYDLIRLNPGVLIIESVPGMASPKKALPFLLELARDARRRGYCSTIMHHDGGLLGLPHHRRRVFFITHRYKLHWPEVKKRRVPTIGEVIGKITNPGEHYPMLKDHQTVWSQLKLAKVRDGHGGFYPKYERFKSAWCRIFNEPATGPTSRVGRPLFMHTRLHAHRPMNAFVGNYYFHPTSPRFLGVQEMKAVCGYPLSYKMAGRPGKTATLLAQAVLPPVGAWVGRMCKLTLELAQRPNELTVQDVDLIIREKTNWQPLIEEIKLDAEDTI